MNREEARDYINSMPLNEVISLEKAKHATAAHKYVCPVCGSGSGKNGTSALTINNKNRVVCFAGGCFGSKGEDTLGALRIIWQCDENEAIKRAGVSLEEGKAATDPAKRSRKKEEPAEEKQFKSNLSFYRQCHEALLNSPEALNYLINRGIFTESINRFNLGYCETWKHSKAGEAVSATRRLIIPRTEYTYIARRIDPAKNEKEAAYNKMIEGTAKDLFNLKAIKGASIVWICEGELDAISLYQACASSVVAIGSKNNIDAMAEAAKTNREAIYIIALDNDAPKEGGENPTLEAQNKLYDLLNAERIRAIKADPAKLYGGMKDANEAFIKDSHALMEMVINGEENAEKFIRKSKETTWTQGGQMLDKFLERVADPSRPYEPIRTGITDIDRALEGGFIRGTLVTLGAPPAMGKTALAQYIFENMARNGHDVLYINLEMTREQLLARSISRLAFLYEEKNINALEVLRGYAWTEDQRRTITNAANIYREEIAPHFIYNPDETTNNIDSILQAMKNEAKHAQEAGKPAPICCIDYLQLITSAAADPAENIKNIIFELKNYAREYNTIVFLIVANNRASNKSGSVDLESGRDTSAIEYSGDIMLGLVYTAIDERRKYNAADPGEKPNIKEYDLETIRRLKKEAYENGEDAPAVCNEITLKVIKNRFGDSERTARLIFDGKHANYRQIEKQKGAYSTWKRI